MILYFMKKIVNKKGQQNFTESSHFFGIFRNCINFNEKTHILMITKCIKENTYVL